jgi:hypothetical protein
MGSACVGDKSDEEHGMIEGKKSVPKRYVEGKFDDAEFESNKDSLMVKGGTDTFIELLPDERTTMRRTGFMRASDHFKKRGGFKVFNDIGPDDII